MLQKCHIQRYVPSCCHGKWLWFITCLTCLLVSTVNSKAHLENDAFLDTVGLIRKHRYPVEQFPVLTKDGFLLSLVRIPLSRGIPRTFKTKPGPPVLLVHGIISSADDWVLNSPINSPGFLLSDAGYDVWLINTRGTPYSKHLKHKRNSKPFWDFSFDEIGLFDVPAAIDFVLEHTGHPQLTILGWSQGTTDIMVTLSLKPQYNHKVKLFVAMAPVANITHLASPMTMLIPFQKIIKRTLDMYNGGGVFPSSRHSRSMYNHMCNSHIRGLCFLPVSVSVGISPHQLNKTRIPVYMAHMPSGTSTKNLIHFVQNRQHKDFRRFDYGEQENFWRYGTLYPPKYPLYKISAPTALFWGKGDRLATPEDVNTLRRELRHTIVYDYLVPEPDFAHLDFTIGINAKEVLHDPVLHVINEFNKGLHLGLYRPEYHDTLFESPVPPFPMPPITHKNPSGLPIMNIKVASIAVGKPWHQDQDDEPEFPRVPHKPTSMFDVFRPPQIDTSQFHFGEDPFALFGGNMEPTPPKTHFFGNHRGFGSSHSHGAFGSSHSHHGFGNSHLQHAFSPPMFVHHVPDVPTEFAFASHGLQSHVEDIPVSYVQQLRPPPPVRELPKATTSPPVSVGNKKELPLHGHLHKIPPLPAPELSNHVPEISHHREESSNHAAEALDHAAEISSHAVEVSEHGAASSKPLPKHIVNFGLDSKPVAMYPDNNGGFQTDWFPVTGDSKKLKLQDLMPSASKKQTSAPVAPTPKPGDEKTNHKRIRGPHQTPWRVV